MNDKIELEADVTYKGRAAIVVGRCYVGNEWLYQLRFASGTIVDYVPARMIRAAR